MSLLNIFDNNLENHIKYAVKNPGETLSGVLRNAPTVLQAPINPSPLLMQLGGEALTLKGMKDRDYSTGVDSRKLTTQERLAGLGQSQKNREIGKDYKKTFQTDVENPYERVSPTNSKGTLRRHDDIADEATRRSGLVGFAEKQGTSIDAVDPTGKFDLGNPNTSGLIKRSILDYADDQAVERDIKKKDAEWEYNYGTSGVPRVTDDGAHVIGSPERGATRQGQRSRKQIEGDVAAENAGNLQAAQQKAIDESASGKANIGLTKQRIGESQANIATNQFNMDFKLAQQAENTRRYNLEYARDEHRDGRNFAFEKHKYSTNRADNIRRDNQQLDLRMFELELQKEMSEDARQQGMINNLLGGLFSLVRCSDQS